MRTFIFGAGASLHAGYPLASDLWHAMERWAGEIFPADHDFTGAVDTMNAEFDSSKSFEIVLMELDNRIEPFLRERPTTDEGLREKVMLVYLRSTIKHMIPIYFNSIRPEPAQLYETFANEVIVPGDAVITFNYDLSLDRELSQSGKWSIGDGYGFPVPPFPDSPCRLLKLHGSTNWSGEPFGGLMGFGQTAGPPMGQRPVIQRAEFDYLGYKDGFDPGCHDGRVRVESIIMPTANKQFYLDTSYGREWQEFWDSIWSRAAAALRDSSEVYLIGYSVPEYDTRARELFQSAIGATTPIKVCCHEDTEKIVRTLRWLGSVGAQPAAQTNFAELMADMRTHALLSGTQL